MKNSFIIAALVSLVSLSAFAGERSGDGSKGVGGNGVSNIERQTKLLDNTSFGKAQSEWAKGRTVKPCESIQNYNPAFSRGSKPPKCEK